MDGMKVCFIGSGRLATHLSVRMREVGFEIVQVYSRTERSARLLSEELGCAFTTCAKQLTNEADLYVCALKDSVIEEVLDQAVEVLKNKILVHTAGSIPATILAKYTDQFGVIYPLQSFSIGKNVDFSKIPVFIEGSSAYVVENLRLISEKISGKVYEMSSEDRKKMHLAAVFVSNFSNHVYALGDQLVKSAGVPFDVLLPLIEETAEKVHVMNPVDAQSGPAVRNDQNVMSEHLKMLESTPQLKRVYEVMSDSIRQLSILKEEKNV
jgi:predicted short-subunit dehydrogenase-like oxidoreductase (DUF2520 family)